MIDEITTHEHGNCNLCDFLDRKLEAALRVVRAAQKLKIKGMIEGPYDEFKEALAQFEERK